jgi:hypothetical protein
MNAGHWAQVCDKGDHSSQPAQANSSYLGEKKHTSQKRAGGMAQGVGTEFKPQYWKTKRTPGPV